MKGSLNPNLCSFSNFNALVMASEICFYRASEKPYGPFSNLFKREILFEGEPFPTAEHAYQAGKPRREAVRDWLMAAPSPALLAMAAHGLYVWDVRSDWSKIKFARMHKVLLAKFTQHADLEKLLVSTGDKTLVETPRANTPVNRLWGRVDGKGKNMLGLLLMEVREELLQTKYPSGKPKDSVCKSIHMVDHGGLHKLGVAMPLEPDTEIMK
uniref:NADAR domain-containing protein n=1 Tax=Candidatus Kentrum sp. FW TaxID=2126338 RepID=A0A450TLH7_9GAMM|nr:MAG: hypothetical protein BECKFW1821C_GA0114237_10158 [Candidatus Kentron sp. FW]